MTQCVAPHRGEDSAPRILPPCPLPVPSTPRSAGRAQAPAVDPPSYGLSRSKHGHTLHHRNSTGIVPWQVSCAPDLLGHQASQPSGAEPPASLCGKAASHEDQGVPRPDAITPSCKISRDCGRGVASPALAPALFRNALGGRSPSGGLHSDSPPPCPSSRRSGHPEPTLRHVMPIMKCHSCLSGVWRCTCSVTNAELRRGGAARRWGSCAGPRGCRRRSPRSRAACSQGTSAAALHRRMQTSSPSMTP